MQGLVQNRSAQIKVPFCGLGTRRLSFRLRIAIQSCDIVCRAKSFPQIFEHTGSVRLSTTSYHPNAALRQPGHPRLPNVILYFRKRRSILQRNRSLANLLAVYRIFALVHLLSLLIFVPSFFTVSGLVVAVITHWLFDGFGVSIGYHRLLTHADFNALSGSSIPSPFWCLYSPGFTARWVAVHRMHHQHSDHQPDPHSPLVTFFGGIWSGY